MAKPLRINKFKYTSDIAVNGLVCYESQSFSTKTNKLIILKKMAKDKFYIPQKNIYIESKDLDLYLEEGDILFFNDLIKTITTILTKNSNENTLLLTERCNSNCLFCSQPPKKINDEYLFEEALFSILAFNSTKYIGLSGGEITINKNLFLNFIKELKKYNNTTPLHILTNGKNFSDFSYTKEIISNLNNRDLIWAIPIYAHYSELHDHIVQAHNSLIKTTKGILNLLELGQRIEIRIVVTKLNYKYLENIIDYIFSSFKIINYISIMNLEPIGYARENYKELFINIEKQNSYLKKATRKASLYGYKTSLYNYPYCLLDQEIQTKSVKSISDWKNYYPKDCNNCKEKNKCGGFFTSASKKYIEKVKPL